MRKQLRISRVRRRMTLVFTVMLAMPVALSPHTASAGIFDFLFGGDKPQRQEPQQQQPSNAFADPFGLSTPNAGACTIGFFGRRTFHHLLRAHLRRPLFSADRPRQRHARADVSGILPGSPDQSVLRQQHRLCRRQYGRTLCRHAERLRLSQDSEADCTCNGRDPAGLAPVDLSLDSTLRPGDIVATSSGLVAYSGTNAGTQTAQFTPVNNYPGLTADLRARLGEMKVAPVAAELPEDTYSSQDITGSVPEPRYAQPMAPDATLPKIATPSKRAL